MKAFAIFDREKGDRVLALEPAMPAAELSQRALRHLHLQAVTLNREFPEFLGPRLMTNCPIDHQGEPRSALAAYMRTNIQTKGT